MRKLLFSSGAALLAVISMAGIVRAQDSATPAPLGADRCTVDPIDADAYNAAITASVPPLQQPANPTGTPADEATVAAVTDVIEQSVACTNIGDLGRLLAILDPAYAPILLGVPYGDVPAAVEAAAATSVSSGPATPLVDDYDQGSLVSTIEGISDVIVLDDGRVAAVATIKRADYPATTFTIYLRFDTEQQRYIITYYTAHP